MPLPAAPQPVSNREDIGHRGSAELREVSRSTCRCGATAHSLAQRIGNEDATRLAVGAGHRVADPNQVMGTRVLRIRGAQVRQVRRKLQLQV
jgi:hypothetical protein